MDASNDKHNAASDTRARRVPSRTRLAYHEAGHAVMDASIGEFPARVSIREQGLSRGRCVRYVCPAFIDHRDIQISLAGRAAEEALTGRRSRSMRGNIGQALCLLEIPELDGDQWGTAVKASDEYKAVKGIMMIRSTSDREVIMTEFERLYSAALESVRAAWPGVENTAKLLLKHEEVDARLLSEAFSGIDIHGPIWAVQKRLFGRF